MIKSLKDIFENILMFVIVFFFPFAVNITIFNVVSQAIRKTLEGTVCQISRFFDLKFFACI